MWHTTKDDYFWHITLYLEKEKKTHWQKNPLTAVINIWMNWIYYVHPKANKRSVNISVSDIISLHWLWYKRDKTLLGIRLLENNQLQGADSNSTYLFSYNCVSCGVFIPYIACESDIMTSSLFSVFYCKTHPGKANYTQSQTTPPALGEEDHITGVSHQRNPIR